MRAFLIGVCFIAGWMVVQVMAQPPSSSEAKRQAEVMKKRSEMHVLISQLSQLVHNRNLQNELELEAEQISILRETTLGFQKRMQEFAPQNAESQTELMRLAQGGEHAAAMKLSTEIARKQNSVFEELITATEATLLPKQWSRLQQITLQKRVKTQNPFRDEFGMVLAMSRELDLTAEERNELMKVITRVRNEFYQELEVLRNDANDRILAVLPAAKRDKIQELFGDVYDQASRDRSSLDEKMIEQKKREAEMRERRARMQAEATRRAEQQAKSEKD